MEYPNAKKQQLRSFEFVLKIFSGSTGGCSQDPSAEIERSRIWRRTTMPSVGRSFRMLPGADSLPREVVDDLSTLGWAMLIQLLGSA